MRTAKYLTMMACLLYMTTAVIAQEDATKLVAGLASPDIQVQIAACQGLAKLGPRAQAAVPGLIKVAGQPGR